MENITKLMRECNNYFASWGEYGNYKVENNVLEVRGTYFKGQYVRVMGSIMNDGVYKVESYVDSKITLQNLTDEEFCGYIYSLSVPKDFIFLSEQIEEYTSSIDIKKINITSESFNNYSKSIATGQNGSVLKWQDIFNGDIQVYKKIFDDTLKVKTI